MDVEVDGSVPPLRRDRKLTTIEMPLSNTNYNTAAQTFQNLFFFLCNFSNI